MYSTGGLYSLNSNNSNINNNNNILLFYNNINPWSPGSTGSSCKLHVLILP